LPLQTAAAPPQDSQSLPGATITATNRTVLPPLEVEVVAGNQHRPLPTSNQSVKVEMQSSEGVSASETAPPALNKETAAAVPDTSAQVSLAPATAERVSHSVKPDYPLLAKQMKVQGAVVLQALINKSGQIEDLHVVSGPSILAAAAQEAVKQWRFKPYYQQGQPVETEARITVNFTISTY
jgi:protein TonB